MFEHLALLADDDALLPLPLDVDDCMNMENAAAPLHGIADDPHGMRHLFARAHQELLAHELSDDRIVRSIGRHGIGEPFGALGKIARDQVDEGVDVEPLGSGKHDHVVELAELASRRDLLEHALRRGEVGFSEYENALRRALGNALCNPCVAAADGLRRVNEEAQHINVSELGERAFVELASQGVMRLMEARGINEDDLDPLAPDHPAHTAPRSLGNR